MNFLYAILIAVVANLLSIIVLYFIIRNALSSVKQSAASAQSFSEIARQHSALAAKTVNSFTSEGSLLASINSGLSTLLNKFSPTTHTSTCQHCNGDGEVTEEVPAAFKRLITDAFSEAGYTAPKPVMENHADTPAKSRSRR